MLLIFVTFTDIELEELQRKVKNVGVTFTRNNTIVYQNNSKISFNDDIFKVDIQLKSVFVFVFINEHFVSYFMDANFHETFRTQMVLMHPQPLDPIDSNPLDIYEDPEASYVLTNCKSDSSSLLIF